MTGPDLSKILRLPDSEGLANEVVLEQAHDVNFGAPISQMVRLVRRCLSMAHRPLARADEHSIM